MILCSGDLGATWTVEKLPASVDPKTSFSSVTGDEHDVWVTGEPAPAVLLHRGANGAWEDRQKDLDACQVGQFDDNEGGFDHFTVAETDAHHVELTAWAQISPGMMHFDLIGGIEDLTTCKALTRRDEAPNASWTWKDTTVVAGNQGFLSRSDDGGATWHDYGDSSADQLDADQSVTVSCVRPGLAAVAGTCKSDVWAAGVGGQILHSIDQGVSWQPAASPTSADLTAIAAEPNHIVAVGVRGTVIVSHDGKKFDLVKTKLSADLTSLFMRGKSLRASDGASVFLSDDDGATWKTRPVPGGAAVTWISLTEAWAASDKILHSVDGGATWATGPSTEMQVEGFLAAGDRLYAFGGENPDGTLVEVSTDKGKTWTQIPDARIGSSIDSGWASAKGDRIVLTGGRGRAISSDGGKTWTVEHVAAGFGAVWGDDAGDVFTATAHGVAREP